MKTKIMILAVLLTASAKAAEPVQPVTQTEVGPQRNWVFEGGFDPLFPMMIGTGGPTTRSPLYTSLIAGFTYSPVNSGYFVNGTTAISVAGHEKSSSTSSSGAKEQKYVTHIIMGSLSVTAGPKFYFQLAPATRLEVGVGAGLFEGFANRKSIQGNASKGDIYGVSTRIYGNMLIKEKYVIGLTWDGYQPFAGNYDGRKFMFAIPRLNAGIRF